MTQVVDDFVAVESGSEIAGGITYWSLSDDVQLEALRQSLEMEGIDEALWPSAPSLEQALTRSAHNAVQNKRQLVRPLANRGAWAFVQEKLVNDEPVYETLLVGRVKRVEGLETLVIELGSGIDPDSPTGLAAQAIRENIRGGVDKAQGILVPTDVSNWLVGVLRALQSVSLRDRGGIYFVPRDRLETWRLLTGVLRAESKHTVFEIPAMKTEEAVEAILTSVASEMTAELAELEDYLIGETSTRGLNAAERKLSATREKLTHYVGLLGRALPDLSARLEQVVGSLTAAQLVKRGNAA